MQRLKLSKTSFKFQVDHYCFVLQVNFAELSARSTTPCLFSRRKLGTYLAPPPFMFFFLLIFTSGISYHERARVTKSKVVKALHSTIKLRVYTTPLSSFDFPLHFYVSLTNINYCSHSNYAQETALLNMRTRVQMHIFGGGRHGNGSYCNCGILIIM